MEQEQVIETVPVEAVRIDGGTQPRAQLNEEAVGEYAEAIKAGQALPAIVVFFDGSVFWLADGFHRYHAYARAGVLDLPADIRVGTLREAILFSVRANADHGLRRTNEDKRRAVMTLLQDEEWTQWSDNAIAKACAVSTSFVGDMRRAIFSPTKDSSPPATRTVTRNGTTYAQKVRTGPKPAAPAKAAAEPAAGENPHQEQACPPSVDEIAEAIEAERADQARILAILDAADPLAEAIKSNQSLARQLRATEDMLNSAKNDINLLVRQNKAMRAKLDQMGAPA